jgi:hypothetical protein
MTTSLIGSAPATVTSRVRRNSDKVWIDGVEGFHAGDYGSSVHGAQARICQVLGESLTYEQLLCYGGLAFRVQAHQEMCPSAGHPCCGFACIDNSNRALPWTTRFYESFPWAPPKPDRDAFEKEVCVAIRQSIDRGVPVHYGSEEDGLILGYTDEGRRWWCMHPYHNCGRECFWHDQAQGFAGGKWPWGISVWTEPKPRDQRPTPRESTRAGLKQAIEMWRTEKRDAYFVGDAAYAHWLKWLEDVDSGRIADPKAGMQGNGWCFDMLIQCRRVAWSWLNEIADGGDARPSLAAAADHYRQIVDGCTQGLSNCWELAVGPDRAADWTSAMRRSQIQRLADAREHDRAAIQGIEAALQTL